MKIKSRLTRAFIELKVDEIETTIFESDKKQMEEMRDNLLDIIDDLNSYINYSNPNQ